MKKKTIGCAISAVIAVLLIALAAAYPSCVIVTKEDRVKLEKGWLEFCHANSGTNRLGCAPTQDLVDYYRECKKDRLSKAAFVCATDVYCELAGRGKAQFYAKYPDAGTTNEALREEMIRDAVQGGLKDILAIAATNDHTSGVFSRLQEMNDRELDPKLREAIEEEFDAFFEDWQHNCHLMSVNSMCVFYAPSPSVRLPSGAPSERSGASHKLPHHYDTLEDALRDLNGFQAEHIVKFHKLIMIEWKRQKQGRTKGPQP